MRTHIYTYSLMICILVAAICLKCTKDTSVLNEPTYYWGEMQVQKNGQVWTGRPFARATIGSDSSFFIQMDSLDNVFLRRERFHFIKIPKTLGTYPVYNSSGQEADGKVGSLFSYVDDDLAYGQYRILEADSSSFLTVDSYDAETGEVRGTFTATYIVEYRPFPQAPDTLRLRNGQYHTKVLPR